MRWEIKIEDKPYHGKQRVITRFALLPIRAEDGEVRWLEKVSIMQTYLINPSGHWINDILWNWNRISVFNVES